MKYILLDKKTKSLFKSNDEKCISSSLIHNCIFDNIENVDKNKYEIISSSSVRFQDELIKTYTFHIRTIFNNIESLKNGVHKERLKFFYKNGINDSINAINYLTKNISTLK